MNNTISYDYFKLLCFSFLTCFIAYGYALTNFSLTIDSEQTFFSDISLSLARWGTNLVRYHIFKGIIPYFTLLISLVMLSVAAVEITKLFRLRTSLSYLFCALFLSFPQMAYQMAFTMQADVVALGFLVSGLSIKFFLESTQGRFNSKAALYFLVSALLFMFVIALYQALVFIPVLIYLVIFFQRTLSENYNYKAEFKNAFLFVGLVIISFILYVISVKIFCPPSTSTGFMSSYLSGDNSNMVKNFIDHLRLHFEGRAYYGNKTFVIATLSAAILLIMLLFSKGKQKILSIMLLVIIFIFPFIIAFPILISYKPPRLFVASGIAFAFLFVHLVSKVPYQRFVVIVTSLIVLTNIYFITMLFWSHHKLYSHDVNIAKRIDNKIYQKYPEFDPATHYVYFFGGLPYSTHDRFRLPDSEVFGGSLFNWDGGSNDRIINLFKWSDIAYYKMVDNKDIYLKIKDSIGTMPTYPKDGYVKRVDNVIIVKLGDTKGAPLWVE